MPAGINGTARYLVRYWLFYSFDDWRSRGDRLWQAHEGDWENITVALDASRNPIFAAYSQHCSGTVRAWSKVTHMQTHPIDYVALGFRGGRAKASIGLVDYFSAHTLLGAIDG